MNAHILHLVVCNWWSWSLHLVCTCIQTRTGNRIHGNRSFLSDLDGWNVLHCIQWTGGIINIVWHLWEEYLQANVDGGRDESNSRRYKPKERHTIRWYPIIRPETDWKRHCIAKKVEEKVEEYDTCWIFPIIRCISIYHSNNLWRW